jgi:hypothetical protein
MQPLTRGPEADETKTHDSDTATPRPGVTVKAAAAPFSAFRTCADVNIQRALLATRRRHGVQVREQLCRRALHARADGLDATDHLLCEGAVCTRVCDPEFSHLRRCHAAPTKRYQLVRDFIRLIWS